MFEIKFPETNFFICVVNLSIVSIYIFIGFIGPMAKKYYCPRCKNPKVFEYPDSIECPDCLLEFDKKHIGVIPDDEILAFSEMDSFFDSFEEIKDPEKAKQFFDSIMEDLEDEN
ncbi:MAG: hypothetical protein ACFE94_18900 [Candidatus Hodarchaeota archaeon]